MRLYGRRGVKPQRPLRLDVKGHTPNLCERHHSGSSTVTLGQVRLRSIVTFDGRRHANHETFSSPADDTSHFPTPHLAVALNPGAVLDRPRMR